MLFRTYKWQEPTKTYNTVFLYEIVYDIVRLKYDVVYNIAYNIYSILNWDPCILPQVRERHASVKTYDIGQTIRALP